MCIIVNLAVTLKKVLSLVEGSYNILLHDLLLCFVNYCLFLCYYKITLSGIFPILKSAFSRRKHDQSLVLFHDHMKIRHTVFTGSALNYSFVPSLINYKTLIFYMTLK